MALPFERSKKTSASKKEEDKLRVVRERREKRLAGIKDGQVLLVKTPDMRDFLTFKENYNQLIEFAKTCQAEISLVKVDEPTKVEVLELEDLAKSICDHQKVHVNLNYEVLETRIRPGVNAAPPALPADKQEQVVNLKTERERRATEIRDYIRGEFLAGKKPKINDLSEKFKTYELSKGTFYSYMRQVRQILKIEGYQVLDVSRFRFGQ